MKPKKNLFTLLLVFQLLAGTCKAQYNKLLDFSGSYGTNPHGGLVSDGTYMYGMTQTGGPIGSGTIFRIKPDGTGYLRLLNFSASSSGGAPYGSLLYDGTYLYGMTSAGGSAGSGVIFKIKTDGSGFAKLLDFNLTNGGLPYGSLISDGTYLYGMARNGGAGNKGVVFKIKTDGTSFAILHDFTGIGTGDGDGPYGSLVSDGTFLYGMTHSGGTGTLCSGNCGIIFKVKPDGTGYTKILDFTSATGGGNPFGDLCFDGTFLYGMTAGGVGVFKIKPDGTAYTDLHDFGSIVADGVGPSGSLTLSGTTLYGMTNGGGTSNDGTIFKIKTDGTSYAKLFDFVTTPSGQNPVYSKLLLSGSSLFGMTYLGGTGNYGVLFSFGVSAAGIAENDISSELSIFPNPGEGTFNIKTSGISSKGTITIQNTLGQQVYAVADAEIDGAVIDLSNLPAGIYFVNILTEKGSAIKKVVIDK